VGAILIQHVEVLHPVAIREGADPGQRAPLAPRHRRQVGFDVRQPVAVAVGKAPSPRRHPGGHLHHLTDAVALDRPLQKRVDRQVASQEVRLQ
jgi:hypothetical protein